MATRLYLPSSGTPGSTPPVRSDWERSSSAFIRAPMGTAKSNTALTTISSAFGSTNTSQTCYYQGISGTFDSTQVVSGTVSLVVGRCGETSTGGDAHLAFALRVMQGDTTVERGLLVLQHATATEFPLIASAATRIHSAIAISTVTAEAGDRLALEVGIHGVTPVNETMQIRVGDPTATADFALTSGLTTDLVSWVELSANLTFGTPPDPPTSRAFRRLSLLGIG